MLDDVPQADRMVVRSWQFDLIEVTAPDVVRDFGVGSSGDAHGMQGNIKPADVIRMFRNGHEISSAAAGFKDPGAGLFDEPLNQAQSASILPKERGLVPILLMVKIGSTINAAKSRLGNLVDNLG